MANDNKNRLARDMIITSEEIAARGLVDQGWIYAGAHAFKSEGENRLYLLDELPDRKYRVFFIVPPHQ